MHFPKGIEDQNHNNKSEHLQIQESAPRCNEEIYRRSSGYRAEEHVKTVWQIEDSDSAERSGYKCGNLLGILMN